MPVDNSGLNPIIESLVESSRQQLTRQQLAQQAEQFKAEQALRQQHQGMLEKQLEQEHDINLQKLENERKFREAAADASRVEALGNLYKIASQPGVDLSGFINPGQGTIPGVIGAERPSTISIPGTNISFPNFLPNPEALGQARIREAEELATAKSRGEAAGALPSQLTLLGEKHKQETELKQMELAAHLQNTVLQGKNQLEAAKIHGAYQNATANINGMYHLKAAAMLNSIGEGDNANKAKQLTDGVYDGVVDYSKLPINEKRLVDTYSAANGELASLPNNQKEYKAKLDSMTSLQNLINEYRTIANNYSVDSPGSLSKGNANFRTGVPIIGTRGIVTPGSELASKLASVKSEGGTIAAFFDKMMGRRSEVEVARETAGWFNPAFTRQQNLDMIEQHVKRMQNDVRALFAAQKPDRINKVLGDRGVTDFGAFSQQSQTFKFNKVNPQTGQRIGSNDGVNWVDKGNGEVIK